MSAWAQRHNVTGVCHVSDWFVDENLMTLQIVTKFSLRGMNQITYLITHILKYFQSNSRRPTIPIGCREFNINY